MPTPIRLCSYGKPIQSENGPRVPYAEHQISHCDFPEPLRDRYSGLHWLAPASTARRLVAIPAQPLGAFFILPVAADGQAYVLAGRIRPRPERGEGRPGRSFDQINLFAFTTDDWAQHAPQLLAQAPLWLKAEPELAAPRQAERQHEPSDEQDQVYRAIQRSWTD